MKIVMIGSAQDSGYRAAAEQHAAELGCEIARRGHVLLYGPEPHVPSISYFAAKAAKEAGGLTIAVAIGSARSPFYDPGAASLTIYTEGSGGGLREIVLVNSGDAVIANSGGSGTLLEMSIAYMNFIPVVAMEGSGGWADELRGRFLDAREKFRIASAATASEAVTLAEQMHAALRGQPSQFESSNGRR